MTATQDFDFAAMLSPDWKPDNPPSRPATPTPTVKRIFAIGVDQMDRLTQRSRMTGAPKTELVRRALTLYLDVMDRNDQRIAEALAGR